MPAMPLPCLISGTMHEAEAGITLLHLVNTGFADAIKKRKELYTFRRQFNEKPISVPGRPMMML